MSFQAYLDAAEQKTGMIPQELVGLATARGFGPGTEAGPVIGDEHVGTTGSHRDESAVLRLDGIAARTAAP
jgi:hypothetical protein